LCRWSRTSCGWGSGLGGGPDVPHAALEGSTPLPVPTLALSPSNGGGSAGTSPSGTEGISGVGKRTDISVNNHHHQQHQQLNHRSSAGQLHTRNVVSGSDLVKLSHQQPTRLVFVMELTASRDWRWEGALWRGRLYLEVPTRLVQTGSKEGFVALLEYAEEELLCSHVILALAKDRQDRHDVVRTFMFLGFSVLAPGHELIPTNSNNLFLACSLE